MIQVARLLPGIPTSTATATATATGPGATATATATAGPGGTATATGPGASAFAAAGGVQVLPRSPLTFDPCHCFRPEPPRLHCFDTLSESKDGKVHTPGGYTIEANGNTNWKITGPDGKSTCVEGDPHVKESDGGKWDFKRNSSFVLPDGTRINVKTAPSGNGMTVTSGLEIVNGVNRVQIDGVNTHCPHTSSVQLSGQQWNTQGWDRFTMGRQTDDWAFGGREIVGSEKGGEVLKVGNHLPPGNPFQGMIGDIRRMLDCVPHFRPPAFLSLLAG